MSDPMRERLGRFVDELLVIFASFTTSSFATTTFTT
jgi:hypothetical protein